MQHTWRLTRIIFPDAVKMEAFHFSSTQATKYAINILQKMLTDTKGLEFKFKAESFSQ